MSYQYILLFGALCGLILSFGWQFNMKAGNRFLKTKIPEKSFFKKIYPFKEDPLDPLLYIKFIPFLVCCLIAFIIFILYIIYWINPSLLDVFLKSRGCIIVSGVYIFITGAYLVFLQI